MERGDAYCPVWPHPHPRVAEELLKNNYPQEKCPHLWEWFNRLYALRDQIAIYNQKSGKQYS